MYEKDLTTPDRPIPISQLQHANRLRSARRIKIIKCV